MSVTRTRRLLDEQIERGYGHDTLLRELSIDIAQALRESYECNGQPVSRTVRCAYHVPMPAELPVHTCRECWSGYAPSFVIVGWGGVRDPDKPRAQVCALFHEDTLEDEDMGLLCYRVYLYLGEGPVVDCQHPRE
jgi:hypothetical protein